jgi:capsular exopolysaccharide synthesis family protein
VEIIDYLRAVRRFWLSCLITVAAAVGVGVLLLAVLPKSFTAETRVFLTVVVGNSGSDLASGTNYAQNQVDSFAEVAVSPLVLDPAISKLGLQTTADELASHIGVQVRDGTSVMVLSATDAKAELAADIANAVSDALVAAVDQLSPVSSDDEKLVWATVITRATVPQSTSFPPTRNTLLLAALAGVLLALIQAVIRHRRNRHIVADEDVAKVTDVPVVAHIGEDEELSRPGADKLALAAHTGEDYRRLRTNVSFLGSHDGAGKAFVVTSAVPSEGKTTVSLNLARVLAQAGERVLLVDADLRNPTIGSLLDLHGSVGLTDVLVGRAQSGSALVDTGIAGLHAVLAGEIPPNPSELLASPRMREFLAEATSRFSYVIIDSPPLLPVTDAAVIAHEADGALMVTSTQGTTMPQLAEALEALRIANGAALGIVLNKLRRDPKRYGRYGYGYYHGHAKT